MTTDKPNATTDSFASLFEGQGTKAPSRAKSYRIGERIDAVVARVGKDAVFVELDGKRQAWIDGAELRADDGTIPFNVGDSITASVVEIDRSGNIRLGRSMGKANNLAALETAKEAGVAIEGKVAAHNKGGFEIDLSGGAKAFCPISQMDNRFVQDPNVFVGRTLNFIVTEIREGGRSIVLSRRTLLEREAREAAQKILKDLTPGAVVRGTISGIREFGAFVDLGGIEGLIPLSELSHDRSSNAADIVKPGDVVEVKVAAVKEGTNAKTGQPETKITLSLKALAADPWEAIDTVAPLGKVAVGTVVRLADFGAFVRLASGVEGLLHVSELPGKVEHPSKVLTVGQSISVVVQKVDKESKRLSLSVAPAGLSAGASAPRTTLSIGMVVNGVVERIENYGIFVQVEGTSGRQGRGLVPNADLGVPRGSDVRKSFPEGAKVVAKVMETGDGRLRLSIKAAREDDERSQFDGYRDSVKGPKKLGTFGDLFKKQLDGKKK
ncbi:MAG: S1 RNA-binding domain-containing protein [Polyangiales bacterium]